MNNPLTPSTAHHLKPPEPERLRKEVSPLGVDPRLLRFQVHQQHLQPISRRWDAASGCVNQRMRLDGHGWGTEGSVSFLAVGPLFGAIHGRLRLTRATSESSVEGVQAIC